MKKLTYDQQKAYDRFLAYGNVEVDAPRRSGKTWLCRYIIAKNPKKSFGIFTPNIRMYLNDYGDLENEYSIKYVRSFEDIITMDILIGDEYFLRLDETRGKPTVNVRTSQAMFWKNLVSEKELNAISKACSKDVYYDEFGKYSYLNN